MHGTSLEVLRDVARNQCALPESRRDACMEWVFRLAEPVVGADKVSKEVLQQIFAELDQYPDLATERNTLRQKHEALMVEHSMLQESHTRLIAEHDSLRVEIAENCKETEQSRNSVLDAMSAFRAELANRHNRVWYRRLWRWIRGTNEAS